MSETTLQLSDHALIAVHGALTRATAHLGKSTSSRPETHLLRTAHAEALEVVEGACPDRLRDMLGIELGQGPAKRESVPARGAEPAASADRNGTGK